MCNPSKKRGNLSIYLRHEIESYTKILLFFYTHYIIIQRQVFNENPPRWRVFIASGIYIYTYIYIQTQVHISVRSFLHLICSAKTTDPNTVHVGRVQTIPSIPRHQYYPTGTTICVPVQRFAIVVSKHRRIMYIIIHFQVTMTESLCIN